MDTCIKSARKALGDDGKAQRFIKTLARRGFRFVASVDERTDLVEARAATERNVVEPRMPGSTDRRDEAEVLKLPDRPSIAVLPFETINSGENHSALAEGLYRDITTRLGRARWLFVIARGSSSRFAASQVLEAGSKLAVRYVVQGSIQARAATERVNVALIDTIERVEVWSDIFDRALDDLFAVQDAIADAIVTRVQSELEAAERRRALLKPLATLSAWSAYHPGWWYLDRHSPGDYDTAEELFRVAAQLDPTSARVAAALSYIHRQRAFLELTKDRKGEISRTYELAQQSLSLDPHDPQAHWVMGRALMLRNEVRSAFAEFEVATHLNPSFAMGHYSVGYCSSMLGESVPSDVALQVACRLSPVDPIRFAMIAAQALNAARGGHFGRAADLAELAASQSGAHQHIIAIAAMCSALARHGDASSRYVEKLKRVRPDYTSRQFFRAFPFQRQLDQALWKRAFRLAGIPP